MHRTSSTSSSQISASPPALPYYTSNQISQTPTPTRQSKADQIVQNFYTKVAQIITQARLIHYDSLSSGTVPTHPRQTSHHPKKPNKWFNLEIWDSDVYKEDLKYWRHTVTSSTGLPPHPMIIEFFLDTSELPKDTILVITDEILKRRRVDIHNSGDNADVKSKNILLESWQLTLSHPLPEPPPDLPVVYKKSIAFFRSLYAYVRMLPAFRLYKRIKMNLNNALKIGYRFVLPSTNHGDYIGIDVPIIEGESNNISSKFKFGSIDTPLGVLSLKVNYRSNCEFHIDESAEGILSSNLMDMVDFDEQFFKPTHEWHSPQFPNSLLSGTPKSNPDMKEYSNSELTFPKIHAPPSRPPPSTFASTLSTSRSGQRDNLMSSSPTSRPNVTLVQPFKSPSLSSSPSHADNLPSPTSSDRISSSPLHRSPSSLSLQQRSIYASSTARPLSISGGATLSSSVKSTSSAGSLPRFSSSFSYRHEKNSGFSGRERDESINSRRRSRSSLTNRSDGSTSDRGSFNSSFFASLDPEDDVGQFVRMVDTREPLKMFSRSPTGSDGSGMLESNVSGSVYRSKQLSRFQEFKESHNTLSDSITSVTLKSIPQQLEPQNGPPLGTSSGSASSSISSI
ncbi:3156_t:CDS:10, partial [Funneliformis geosporum]